MMQATLMNFGANTRVVNDIKNAAISIGIGQIVKADIHDVHFHMIRRAVATETLLVVPNDVRQTPRLQTIMSLLRDIETEPYDEFLVLFNTIAEQGEQVNLRPTRIEMRQQLLGYARHEVAIALQLQSKVNIREQGDETTRGDRRSPGDLPKTVVVPPQDKPKVIDQPDRKDSASIKTKKGAAKKPKRAPQSSKSKVKRERL